MFFRLAASTTTLIFLTSLLHAVSGAADADVASSTHFRRHISSNPRFFSGKRNNLQTFSKTINALNSVFAGDILNDVQESAQELVVSGHDDEADLQLEERAALASTKSYKGRVAVYASGNKKIGYLTTKFKKGPSPYYLTSKSKATLFKFKAKKTGTTRKVAVSLNTPSGAISGYKGPLRLILARDINENGVPDKGSADVVGLVDSSVANLKAKKVIFQTDVFDYNAGSKVLSQYWYHGNTRIAMQAVRVTSPDENLVLAAPDPHKLDASTQEKVTSVTLKFEST